MTKRLAVIAILAFALRADAAAGDEDYLAGLSLLEAGRWDQAMPKFEAASRASPEDVRFALALGVAQLLSGRAADGLATMDRAHRLTAGRDLTTRMWLGAAQCMTGDLERARMTGGFRFEDPYDKLVFDAFNSYGMSVFQARLGAEPAQIAKWKRDGEALFPSVAREFARRAKAVAGPAVNDAIIARAADLHRAGKYAEALAEIEQARRSGRDDLYAEFLHGAILARAGGPEAARFFLTDALTLAPDASAAYLARARAHALLGEIGTARRDLSRAFERAAADPRLRLDGGAEAERKEIEALLSAPPGDVGALSKRLLEKASDAAAAAGIAEEIRRAAAPSRLRWDEDYQEGLRAATFAAIDRPKDADAWAALADTLDRNRLVWEESVEPHAKPVPFRVHRPDREIEGAIRAADAALAIDSSHAGAMVSRASAMIAKGDDDGAEKWLRKALAVKALPRAMELLIDVLQRAAAAKLRTANALRMPKTESYQDTRPDGVYTVTRTIMPTAEDLALANRLEAEAKAHLAEVAVLQPKFFEAIRGTPEETFQRARIAWAARDAKTAIALAREVVKPRPSDLRYHHQILEWLRGGDPEAYDEQFTDSANRFHTTASGMLRVAWRALDRGAFDSASAALARARAIDPAEPRALAYEGIAAEERKRDDEAVASYRAALALEESRLRRLGRGLSGGTARLGPDDWPFSAVVSLRLSSLLSRTGRERDAADALALVSRGLAGRVDLPDPMVTAPEKMALPAGELPGTRAEAVPPPANALLAWMQVAAGHALRRAGRVPDAGAAYAAALALRPGEPRALATYNRDEQALLAEARTIVPPRALARFDMAATIAQEGAIACGAVKDPKEIRREEEAAKERQYKAAGDIDREFMRRQLENNAEFARKRRGIDRFDRAGMQALQEEQRKKEQELQAWREAEMKKLLGPGYR